MTRRKILPLHGRANVLPRPDLHNAVYGMLVEGDGTIDTKLFGRVRVESPIQYQTPAPRDSFAFGEIGAMGLPSREGSGNEHPGSVPGSIIGFDLHATGHEVPAAPYYDRAQTFYTLPWKDIACEFVPGCDLPAPVGYWLMLQLDEIMTRRLLFSDTGSGLIVPGNALKGVATNKGRKTKVKLSAGKVLEIGALAAGVSGGAVAPGDWAIFNPLDSLTIRYTRGRELAFVRWDDLEQVVTGDAG